MLHTSFTVVIQIENLTSLIFCSIYGSSDTLETLETLVLGTSENPSLLKISSLTFSLVISLRMFLSVQTGHPPLDFCDMFEPETKMTLDTFKMMMMIIQAAVRVSNLPLIRLCRRWLAT